MKLRNKKTGEIVRVIFLADYQNDEGVGIGFRVCHSLDVYSYDSLAELNEEWEDYEEDELLYVISAEHKSGYQCVLKEDYPEICKVAKELGIGFETEKECKKAIEKLKAWKRLKDKGFRFIDWNCPLRELEFAVDEEKFFKPCGEISEETRADLELLFGGEE